MELQSISDSDDAKSAAEGTQQPNGIALADIVVSWHAHWIYIVLARSSSSVEYQLLDAFFNLKLVPAPIMSPTCCFKI